ncbi:MAG: UDP-N-acetylmuramoyl-tripeptide--D-alanyl-D-alanine ligase [Candidatus Omnitrophica bacterium]|nr:UDP-N-acetylmuramoyl-tripeptide--D-alanyl-D-alanine ligase [Candidatus Omnitrophota bacterium]
MDLRISMRIKEILKITGGKLLSGSPDTDIDLSKISTDSRTIKKGQIFIALKGPNFDGNEFVEDVFRKGAVGAIVSVLGSRFSVLGKTIISVEDTTKAMQDIAACHRRKFKIPVIAVTGTNGKTTVKEMMAAVLSKKFNVLKNAGTENNHIGVPQTLLKLKPSHDICILELGTNHKGEIRSLAGIARPTIAVITNIGPSHLEFLSDLEGVYEEKKEVLEFLDVKTGLAVINGDDKYLSKIKKEGIDILRYGFKTSNDFCARALKPAKNNIIFVVNNKMVYELNLCGTHNIYNALAAIALAGRFGISYKPAREALFDYVPVKMRLDINRLNGIDIINDSYNSNPLSMDSALEALKYYPAKAKWVVSADMLELGRHSVRFHKLIGERIAKADVSGLLTFGALSRHTSSQAMRSGMRRDRLWHCSSHDEIADILKKTARPGDAVLLKGSRGMKMENVLEKFKSLKV